MDEISNNLRDIVGRHRNDGDGGYVLLGEVLKYSRLLSGDDRNDLRLELVHLVKNQDERMWGVALEALVQGWKDEISNDLEVLLGRENKSDEWEGQLIFALLRLQYKPISNRAITYISKHIADGDLTVIPILAALSKANPEECLRLLTPFVIDMIQNGKEKPLTGYIPAIVYNFLDADPNLLALLIRQISAKNKDAGSRVVMLIHEFLDRPYVFNELGNDKIGMLKTEIDGVV